jgi:hypothetical protein
MIASKQTFTGMRLVLDGCTFEGCAFRGCVLVYTGALPVVLVGNSFDAGCRWELTGAARRTLEFLAHLHRSGAERLVENTFDQIRGKPPPGATVM